MKQKSNVQKAATRRRQQQKHKKKKGNKKVNPRDSGSSSTSPVFPDPSDPSSMQFSGRIYLDPGNNKDIYFNIGLSVHGKQAYPVYENWLQPYVPETTFNQWMDTLKNELCNAPTARPKMLETLLTLVTCCVFPCYNAYKQVTFINNLLKFNETIAQESTHDVQLVLICTRPSTQQNMWKDSHGELANRVQPTCGGAPYGINFVLKLPTEIQWPPNAAHAESKLI